MKADDLQAWRRPLPPAILMATMSWFASRGKGADRAVLDLVSEGTEGVARWEAKAGCSAGAAVCGDRAGADARAAARYLLASARTTTPMRPNFIPVASIPAPGKRCRVRR